MEYLSLSLNGLQNNLPLDEVFPGLMANLEALKFDPQRKALTTVSAGEWFNVEINKPVSLLSGCLDKGTKANIGGGSKTRKSFFTFQLCISLAAGLDFLNFPLHGIKRKVLLINFEINEYHFQDRLKGILHGLNLTPDDMAENLYIVNARGLDADFQAIEATALEVRPDLIVIDPFYKLITGDENKPESFKPILKQFDRLAEKSGAAILTIMHYAKGFSGEKQTIDRFSGSGVTARDFDVGFFLTPHADGEDFAVLEVINRNYAPRPAVTVFFDIHRKIFFIDDRRPVVKTRLNGKDSKDNDSAASIGLQLQAILEKPMPKTAFIFKLRANGFSADKARAYCSELLNDGTLEQLNIPGQNNAKIIGYPGAIARLKEGVKTP
ncbi:MAG: AAA family ATPase [Victivallales bacterium]